jgi:hypothetical protein
MVAEYVVILQIFITKNLRLSKSIELKPSKCVVTGKLWTIQICNLKPTEKTVELSLNYQQNRKTT